MVELNHKRYQNKQTMSATLDLHKTSSSPGTSPRDEIRLFSEKDVPIDTSAEEKVVGRPGDRVWEGRDFA